MDKVSVQGAGILKEKINIKKLNILLILKVPLFPTLNNYLT